MKPYAYVRVIYETGTGIITAVVLSGGAVFHQSPTLNAIDYPVAQSDSHEEDYWPRPHRVQEIAPTSTGAPEKLFPGWSFVPKR